MTEGQRSAIEIRLRAIYDDYLASGKGLDRAYHELYRLARSTNRIRRMALDRKEEIAHIAASNLLLKMRDRRTIRYFGKMIWYEVRDACDLRYKKNRALLDCGAAMGPDAATEDQEIRGYCVEDMLGEILEHPEGLRVLVDMGSSPYYAPFVKKIALYIDKRWIYDHAEVLLWAFKRTRTIERGSNECDLKRNSANVLR